MSQASIILFSKKNGWKIRDREKISQILIDVIEKTSGI